MSRAPRYGELNWVNLPGDARRIWSTRHDELEPESVTWKWSWEHEDHDDEVERRNLLRKIIEVTPLKEQEVEVLVLCVIEGRTLDDVGKRWGVTRERVRQVLLKALRRLRFCSKEITGVYVNAGEAEVTTWRQWKFQRRGMLSPVRG